MPKNWTKDLDHQLRLEGDRDQERLKYLQTQFPDCEWESLWAYYEGSFDLHRSHWVVHVFEVDADSWQASLHIKSINVTFNALTARSLEEAVAHLKKRLKTYSEQFGMLAKVSQEEK